MCLRDGLDFERKIFVKQQAAVLLRSELKKVKRGEEIAIGTATDRVSQWTADTSTNSEAAITSIRL